MYRASAILAALIVAGCRSDRAPAVEEGAKEMNAEETDFSRIPEAQWKARLTPQQFDVCRRKGTERAFTGRYWDHKEKGTYLCVACRAPLFESGAKFDSGTGWPSYIRPLADGAIAEKEDRSWFQVRTEVLCARCGSHLGHVFDDGPAPTGLRYCINSAALDFEPESAAK